MTATALCARGHADIALIDYFWSTSLNYCDRFVILIKLMELIGVFHYSNQIAGLCSKGPGTSLFASVQILFAMNHGRRSDGALFPDCPLNRDSESCFEGLMILGGTVDCTRALPEPIRRAPPVAASPVGFFGGGPCGLPSDRAKSGPLPASRADSARSGTGCIKPSIQG
ncbi:hypothetical protein [Burkholderia cenocepacia]|uniref:hypothetical protein n=1 Tax=Burkholderia cenocepacia TaxID=95486 RepID=UPI0011B21530|nr:hypothetical protein [Burkholderia cenocepacia]MCA7967054.1 hypothetical protein [Burkholderia cenocepacia]MDR8055693.1 hypothetical protein [Burkholderia cenocepacia]MDR8066134.1 hypothetical protein [Burkholderia cenocepacia]HEM7882670.1 hypothetical protein [Burkholderia cenocepacia]